MEGKLPFKAKQSGKETVKTLLLNTRGSRDAECLRISAPLLGERIPFHPS